MSICALRSAMAGPLRRSEKCSWGLEQSALSSSVDRGWPRPRAPAIRRGSGPSARAGEHFTPAGATAAHHHQPRVRCAPGRRAQKFRLPVGPRLSAIMRVGGLRAFQGAWQMNRRGLAQRLIEARAMRSRPRATSGVPRRARPDRRTRFLPAATSLGNYESRALACGTI
jgi:hypothetical protein